MLNKLRCHKRNKENNSYLFQNKNFLGAKRFNNKYTYIELCIIPRIIIERNVNIKMQDDRNTMFVGGCGNQLSLSHMDLVKKKGVF